jgi:hypothetical protein
LDAFDPFIKPAYHANTIYLSDSGEYKVTYHGGYTKLLITDKEPQGDEIDKSTVVLINNEEEWIIYRKIDNKMGMVQIQ